jgi:hypothetical protein
MGQVLDGILKRTIEEDFTVNTEYLSEKVDIDNREDGFSVQINYSNGVNVDMVIKLEASVDGENFSEITDSDQNITDSTGTHIYDIPESGVIYIRVKIEVNSGSIDIDKLIYSGKRRH